MKIGIFHFTADVADGVTTLHVRDYSGREVATGKGADISEAREQALATTASEDAREHLLRAAVFPEPPFN